MLSWLSWIFTAGKWLLQLLSSRKSPIVQVAKDDGAQTQKASDEEQAVKTENAVSDAEANAPDTVAGVVSRLDGGTF